MVYIITDISKYIFTLLIMLYIFFDFRYFAARDEHKKKSICKKQYVCMFGIHLLAFVIFLIAYKDTRMIIFYGMQLVFFTVYIFLYKLLYKNASGLLVNNICMLLGTGLIVLTRLSPEKAYRQFIIIVACALVTWIIPFLVDRLWQLSAFSAFYGVFGIALLLAVLLTGNKSFGAQLSITLWKISFQPSEIVKITYVFLIASMLYRSDSLKQIIKVTFLAAVHVLLLVLSKDLGGALIFFITYIFMIFAATGNIFLLMTGIMGGAGASCVAYRLFSHVRTRVLAWYDPWSDIDNKGYQITQSLFAIGTGGWFGMGLTRGMPYKIPVVEKDFVLSAISEELGAIYAICILLICLGCFIQFAMIAGCMKALFFKLVAFGLGTVYITQVFLTAGGVTKFIPSTGVTLPFVSYGGSSMLATFIVFSVMQGLYILKENCMAVYDTDDGEKDEK